MSASAPAAATKSSRRSFAPIASYYFALPIRFVIAWLFFSAFWRRTVLDPGKLDMDSAQWVGHKINHFYPNALLIKGLLGWSIEHPDILWWGLIAFTIIECLVGLGVFFGLFTRISALGIFLLSFFILLGAGWLGATCLDEWQIGCGGMIAAAALWFTGPGPVSIDALIGRKHPGWVSGWAGFFTDGQFMGPKAGRTLVIIVTIFTFATTLITNQAFAGGVYGPLHNLSAKPHVDVTDVKVDGDKLTFTVFRSQGPDTVGANIVELKVLNASGEEIADLYGHQLGKAVKEAKTGDLVKNSYINKVKPGTDGFVVPLGAKATITLTLDKPLDGAAKIELRGANANPNGEKGVWSGTVK